MPISINKPELVRILRGLPGWDADSLAEELFTLLPSLIRETPVKQLKANVGNGQDAPIIITDFGDGSAPIIQINRGNEIITITPDDLGSGGGTPSAPAQAAAFPGTVVSGGGGNVYSVQITLEDGSTSIVSVTQLEGDPAFPHAAGRTAIVIKLGENYFMQIPVWG